MLGVTTLVHNYSLHFKNIFAGLFTNELAHDNILETETKLD
jgi:hypothetical protein